MQDVTPDRGRIIDVASDSGSGVAGSTAAQSQPSDSSGADCQTKCSRYVAARPWIALAYALSTLLIAPAIVYSLLPIPLLRFCYFAVSGCFSIAAGWVMFETITALLSTLYMAGCVHMALDVDPKRKWPTFGYVIPAFLDNEAPILDETLEQYTRLDYPGKVIVQVVYNTKRPMELQEKVLIGSWDGRQVGRVHFSIIPNLKCATTRAPATRCMPCVCAMDFFTGVLRVAIFCTQPRAACWTSSGRVIPACTRRAVGGPWRSGPPGRPAERHKDRSTRCTLTAAVGMHGVQPRPTQCSSHLLASADGVVCTSPLPPAARCMRQVLTCASV